MSKIVRAVKMAAFEVQLKDRGRELAVEVPRWLGLMGPQDRLVVGVPTEVGIWSTTPEVYRKKDGWRAAKWIEKNGAAASSSSTPGEFPPDHLTNFILMVVPPDYDFKDAGHRQMTLVGTTGFHEALASLAYAPTDED
jgi:hypothetical protein